MYLTSSLRASDYSIALPDLEVDPNAMMEMEREVVGATVQRTMSDNVNDPPPAPKPTVASQDVLVRKEEVNIVHKSLNYNFSTLKGVFNWQFEVLFLVY